MLEYEFLSYIEERLSDKTFKDCWVSSNLTPPHPDESFAWWFFYRQSLYFKEFYNTTVNTTSQAFISNNYSFYTKINTRLDMLMQLCGDKTDNELYESLFLLQSQIEIYQRESVFSDLSSIGLIQSRFASSLIGISQSLFILSETAFKCTNQN